MSLLSALVLLYFTGAGMLATTRQARTVWARSRWHQYPWRHGMRVHGWRYVATIALLGRGPLKPGGVSDRIRVWGARHARAYQQAREQ